MVGLSGKAPRARSEYCLALLVGMLACGAVTDPNDVVIGEVHYRVRDVAIAESFPVQIRVTVEMRNLAQVTQTVAFPDGCLVLLRAYGDGAGPVWDQGLVTGCTLAIVEIELAPGQTHELRTGLVSAASILGDSLPDGNYRLTAYLRPGRTIELAAGRVDLAVPR